MNTETIAAAAAQGVLQGWRTVVIDVKGLVGGVAARIAGLTYQPERRTLLIVANKQVGEQAAKSLNEDHAVKMTEISEGGSVNRATYLDVGRSDLPRLLANYDLVILDDRHPDQSGVIAKITKAVATIAHTQIVDVAGPGPRADLGGLKITEDVAGGIVTDAPQDPLAGVEAALNAIDNGRRDHAILVDRKVVPASMSEMFLWGLRSEGMSVSVGSDEVNGVRVSTAFVAGLLSHFSGGPSRLFETYVDDGRDIVAKYATWDEAVEGHRSIVSDIARGHRP